MAWIKEWKPLGDDHCSAAILTSPKGMKERKPLRDGHRSAAILTSPKGMKEW
jgi:hypothetical protein